MTWADGKAALSTKLAAISITSPATISIARVYNNPPATLQDHPAFVLFPPAVNPERMPGGWRENVYTFRARLFVYDSDSERAAAIVESFVEATILAFDDQAALRSGTGFQQVNGPRVDEPGTLTVNERTWSVADFFFDIPMGIPATFT